ncbi:MAG: response regulator [Candidatus Dadabacteria bacterium]|nr:MAG: response regulator [Candidatus Dadabacteria bacterium]
MESPSTTKPVVLVVDDDEMAARAVVKLLERRGFTMLTAPSGRKALEILGNTHVDVLVLDVMMPEMTGLEVCQVLRSEARLSELPIIMLTGCDDFDTRAAAMKLGVSEFLCKPFAHHELIERINNQLEARRIARELDTVAGRL